METEDGAAGKQRDPETERHRHRAMHPPDKAAPQAGAARLAREVDCCYEAVRAMIPNLKDPSTPLPEDGPARRPLWRPLLGMLFLLSFGGGMYWLFTTGIREAAVQEQSINSGLRGVAEDIWLTGSALEIKEADPDLISEVARLRGLLPAGPRIVVTPADNAPGENRATHQIFYTKGDREVLLVRLLLDEGERSIAVVSFRTGAEFQDPAAADLRPR